MLSNATVETSGQDLLPWQEEGASDRQGERAATIAWVLVVDDDDDHRDLMVETLEDAGYRARGVRSGAPALEAIHDEPFLVLADLQMPRMDGSGFLAAMRAERGSRVLPVVFLTAALPSDIQKSAAPVLSKPVDVDELLSVVARHSPVAGSAAFAQIEVD